MIVVNTIIWVCIMLAVLIFGGDEISDDIAFYGALVIANVWIAALSVTNEMK